MKEKIEHKVETTPESLRELEGQKYKELQAAEDEEEQIRKEIDNVLTSTSDREKAEKIVLEKYADLMDAAMKKTSRALREWFDAMKEARKE